jgi:BNR-Asp box repeat
MTATLTFSKVESVAPAPSGTSGFNSVVSVGGGRLLALAPFDNAGTPATQVWRSDDYGLTWTHIGDLAGSGGYGLSRAFSPGANTAFVYQNGVDPGGTYLGGVVWRTIDSGDTWDHPYSGGADYSNDPIVEGVALGIGVLIFVGGKVGMVPSTTHGLRSIDGGATWTSLGMIVGSPYGRAAAIASAGGGKAFLGFDRPVLGNAAGVFIYRSVDWGASWNPVSAALPIVGYDGTTNRTFIHSIAWGQQTILVAGSYGTTDPLTPYLWRSTDEGSTWAAVDLSALSLVDASSNPVPIVEIRYMGSGRFAARTGFTETVASVAGNTDPTTIWLLSENRGASWAAVEIKVGDDPATLNIAPDPATGMHYQTIVLNDSTVITVGRSVP